VAAWTDYQERVASLFRGLGCDASTNERLVGVRTAHDIDVAVRSRHVGFDVLWVVECKHWQTRVSKLHVLALRQIVQDVGADRGLVMAERGFQRGAHEAAELTNVRLASLAELDQTAGPELRLARLRLLQDEVDDYTEQYWSIDKPDRIALGLRGEFALERSVLHVLDVVKSVLSNAARGKYPARADHFAAMCFPELAVEAPTLEGVLAYAEPLLRDVEKQLAEAISVLRSGEPSEDRSS
jgi:restriction system protein